MKKNKTVLAEDTAKKKRTTNFYPDAHSMFCKRCYEFNKGCPNTKTKRIDRECRI
ncbi:MAG: hypothetical protein IKT38_02355 [Clostridia bacterium]|nr:hypothetical protein [Clostridia bacterium]MBR6509431.1 hypothetical protein [Clostridia bacterium]